jgi:hypothetical protein
MGSYRVQFRLLLRVVRDGLAGTLAAIGLSAFLAAGLIWSYLKARWRLRSRGVLCVAPGSPSRVSALNRLRTARVGSDADAPDEYVFGYEAVAYTKCVSHAEDEEGRAYVLASSRTSIPAESKEPGNEDRRIWKLFDLDQAAVRAHFRDEFLLGRLLINLRVCMYCCSPLVHGQTDDQRIFGRGGPFFLGNHWRYYTGLCPGCGWWYVTHLHEETGDIIDDVHNFSHAYATMRRYDPYAIDTPLALARDYLARNQHRLARFDPYRFEELLTECLREVFGDADIVKLGGRKDGGIDIKAVRTGGDTTLIQVKRRADFSKREGVRAVRELHGVMLRDGVPRGMVITTARDFTRQAREEVARAGRHLEHYSMELLPLADVMALLGPPRACASSPWAAHGIRLDQAMPAWGGEEDWVDRTAVPGEVAGQAWGSPWRF